MSLIRTDMTVTPSFSRAGKTASSFSGGQAALHQLLTNLKVDEQRKAAEAAKRAIPGRGGKKESSANRAQGKGGKWLEDEGREHQMSSSPRDPASWRLSTADTSGDAVHLPKTIDWDLLDDVVEERDVSKGGYLREMVQASDQSALEKSPPKLMPSSAFLAPGREGSMDDKRGIPETGRYNPKWEITRRRSKQPLIADRSIWKTKVAVDERPIIAPEIPKSHIKSPAFDQYTSRHDAPGSRIMANVSPAEAKAMFNAKDKGDPIPEGEYDIETYWTKVAKKLNPTYKFSEIGRDDGVGKTEASVPRLYPAVQGHINWLQKSPVMPTVATLSKTVMMDKMGGRDKKKAIVTADDSRVDYRKVDQAFVSSFRTVGGAGPNSVSALEMGRMVARDKTAAAVRERQQVAGGGGVEGYRPSDAAIRVNTDHVVPFSKLLPKPPAELMSTVGRDAPDVWYDREGSLRRTKDKRVPAPHFGKTVARQPEAPPKISTFLEYPKAQKLEKHQRTWKMENSEGHKELVKIPEWVQKQEEAMAATMAASTKKGTIRPHSVAGTSLLEGGAAWGGSPLKGGHVPTPDLGAGGKSRPSPAARVLDKSYDTSKGLAYTQPRSPAARIANGGPGINSEEHRHVRHRLEEEIKGIVQTRPGHAH